ncbi:MAG: hypothetical protein WCJ40_09650 [Planctomycetota bacterium]|nr:hypothetical protein [Planctomycetota bacterium]
MNRIARTCLTVVLLGLPTVAQAQTEEKAAGKPFYGYAGWGILTFGALWGACKASRR